MGWLYDSAKRAPPPAKLKVPLQLPLLAAYTLACWPKPILAPLALGTEPADARASAKARSVPSTRLRTLMVMLRLGRDAWPKSGGRCTGGCGCAPSSGTEAAALPPPPHPASQAVSGASASAVPAPSQCRLRCAVMVRTSCIRPGRLAGYSKRREAASWSDPGRPASENSDTYAGRTCPGCRGTGCPCRTGR